MNADPMTLIYSRNFKRSQIPYINIYSIRVLKYNAENAEMSRVIVDRSSSRYCKRKKKKERKENFIPRKKKPIHRVIIQHHQFHSAQV